MNPHRFENWLDASIEQGLVGIHLTIKPSPGVTPQAVQDELMCAKDCLALGYRGTPPVATTFIPMQIAGIIHAVSL